MVRQHVVRPTSFEAYWGIQALRTDLEKIVSDLLTNFNMNFDFISLPAKHFHILHLAHQLFQCCYSSL